MSITRKITVSVNGKSYSREVEVRMTLADFLRHEIQLTGTHIGCEHGVCGACTILMDGRSTRSCLTLAVQTDGREISTIEGLAGADGELSPLQQAFIDNHGLQCGFCTPGILMTVTELLSDNPDPTEAEVRDTLTGNLCRCTGYSGIVAAVLQTARHLKAGGRSDGSQTVWHKSPPPRRPRPAAGQGTLSRRSQHAWHASRGIRAQ